jgi:hypothetical protein
MCRTFLFSITLKSFPEYRQEDVHEECDCYFHRRGWIVGHAVRECTVGCCGPGSSWAERAFDG